MLLAGTPSATSTRAAVTLGFALVASIANWLLIEPVATKLMLQRYALAALAACTHPEPMLVVASIFVWMLIEPDC